MEVETDYVEVEIAPAPEPQPQQTGKWIMTVCKQCGKEFAARQCKPQVFCSNECCRAWWRAIKHANSTAGSLAKFRAERREKAKRREEALRTADRRYQDLPVAIRRVSDAEGRTVEFRGFGFGSAARLNPRYINPRY